MNEETKREIGGIVTTTLGQPNPRTPNGKGGIINGIKENAEGYPRSSGCNTINPVG